MDNNEKGNIIIYRNEDGSSKIDVKLENETMWLTKKSMAELFDVNVPAINKHLKNIFSEGELIQSSTTSKMEIVQNKLHYATHKHTAPEIIYERADSDKPFMGLMTFKGDHPLMNDITVAKNYLDENELKILNNLVSAYFDLAEVNAIEHKPMYMQDYIDKLDSILKMNGRPILDTLVLCVVALQRILSFESAIQGHTQFRITH